MSAADYRGCTVVIWTPSAEKQERIRSVLQTDYPGVEIQFEVVRLARRPYVKRAFIPEGHPLLRTSTEEGTRRDALPKSEAWAKALTDRISNL